MDFALSVVTWIVLASGSGKPVELPTLAESLATNDVVFLGEEHDNDAGHKAQLQVLKALHARRSDVVLSLEMFERDVQGVLDDYLKGRIDESTFLKHSRPWPNYKKHYRPLVEYAKLEGLDVIASNSPRRSARKMSKDGQAKGAYIARSTSAPKGRYYELFKDAMKEHPGEISEKAMMGMYKAQCLKDDTMAESLADYLQNHPHRNPLVVHACGKFHSDFGEGTVRRLLERRPLTKVGVLSMVSHKRPQNAASKVKDDLKRGHYLVVVKAQPKKAVKKNKSGPLPAPKGSSKKSTSESQEMGTPEQLGLDVKAGSLHAAKVIDAPPLHQSKASSHHDDAPKPREVVTTAVAIHGKPTSRPVAKATAKANKPVIEEVDASARPALGIHPDYAVGEEPGLGVQGVTPGKAAANAGIKTGDLIVSIDGESVEDITEYMEVMAMLKAGQTVEVIVKRKGAQKKFKVTLGSRPR